MGCHEMQQVADKGGWPGSLQGAQAVPVRSYEGRSSIEPDVGVPSHQAAVPEPTSAFNPSQQGHAHRRLALKCHSTLLHSPSGPNNAAAFWGVHCSINRRGEAMCEIASKMRLP